MTAAPNAPRRKRFSPSARRVTVCFAFLFFLTWVNGLFAIAQLQRIDDGSLDAIEGGMASAAVLGQLAADLQAYRTIEATQLVGGAGNRFDRQDNRRLLMERMTRNIRQYESLDSSDEQKRLFMKYLDGWYDYLGRSQKIFDAVAKGDTARAAALFAADRQVFEETSGSIAELVRINAEHGRVVHQSLHDIFTSSLWVILATVAGVSLLIICMVMATAGRQDGHG